MEIPEVVHHRMKYNHVSLSLEPEREAIHLAAVEWWIEGAWPQVEPNWKSITGHIQHLVRLAPLRATMDDYRRVNILMGQPDYQTPPDFPDRESMKLLFWNCRGAGNNTFKRNLTEILRIHKPDILVLMETKVPLSSMGMFFKNLGFTASTSVDPTGRAGGIWILWDNLTVNVRVSYANSQAIHATVHKESYDDWVLSAVYASPLLRNRDQLWGEMEAMAENMTAPWLVAGDFNDFATQGERRSFTPNSNMGKNNKFLERISNCNLMDLGCSGPKLTWTNNRQGMANTKERLDRALCNAAWSSLFPGCTVRNLPRTYSDHSPFVVFTEGKLKLNTDGCAQEETGRAGFGGLFRDERRQWVFGYTGKLESATSLEAELWAIYRGLTIILEKGWRDIQVETDCEVAVHQIATQDEQLQNFPFRALLFDIKALLQRTECTIARIYREGNTCADELARLGAAQVVDLEVFDDPPQSLRPMLVADMVGTVYERA